MLREQHREFARRLPSAGSLYTYNSRGLGHIGGFLTGWMMIAAYALYAPAGVALTSAFASMLVATVFHVAIAPWALFLVIVAAVVLVAYLGIASSSSVDLLLAAGEVSVIAALAITVLVKTGSAHYSAAIFSPTSSPHGQFSDITNAMIYGISAFAAPAAPGSSHRAVLVPAVGDPSSACLHAGQPAAVCSARMAIPGGCHSWRPPGQKARKS